MRIGKAFEECFCLRSKLSRNDIISAKRPGLKTVMDFRVNANLRSGLKTGVENDTDFFGLK